MVHPIAGALYYSGYSHGRLLGQLFRCTTVYMFGQVNLAQMLPQYLFSFQLATKFKVLLVPAQRAGLSTMQPPESQRAGLSTMEPPESQKAGLSTMQPPESQKAGLSTMQPPESQKAGLSTMEPPQNQQREREQRRRKNNRRVESETDEKGMIDEMEERMKLSHTHILVLPLIPLPTHKDHKLIRSTQSKSSSNHF